MRCVGFCRRRDSLSLFLLADCLSCKHWRENFGSRYSGEIGILFERSNKNHLFIYIASTSRRLRKIHREQLGSRKDLNTGFLKVLGIGPEWVPQLYREG